jgi:hypothetical protein
VIGTGLGLTKAKFEILFCRPLIFGRGINVARYGMINEECFSSDLPSAIQP